LLSISIVVYVVELRSECF